MSRSKVLFRIACIFIILFIPVTVFADKTAEKKAVEASNAWLKLIDDGQYAKSWETSADFFKKNVSKERWDQLLNASRKPLGKVLERSVKSERYMTSLPGAPDGEYVVIQYETSFENKKAAIETVTPMLGKDGKWRVSGYYIR
jgi:hypothetical protein